jgi:glycine dehydrogenase subunit 2
MKAIAKEAHETPDVIHAAPSLTRLGRLDEARAARKPVMRWRPPQRPQQ